MEKTVNSALFDFIAACPSALHTADTLAKRLAAERYTEPGRLCADCFPRACGRA